MLEINWSLRNCIKMANYHNPLILSAQAKFVSTQRTYKNPLPKNGEIDFS